MDNEEYVFESNRKEIKQAGEQLDEMYATDMGKYDAAIELLERLGYGWMRFPDGHHEVYE